MDEVLEEKFGNSKNGKNHSEDASNYISLNDEQLKLFNLLKSKSASSPDKWPSIADLTKELSTTSDKTEKILRSLKRKSGVVILTEKNNQDTTSRYGLAPLMLEKTIVGPNYTRNNTSNTYCALYLAEPAFGTKAFDDEYTMKGLALFLKANDYAKDIQQVIIQGGVIPHIPPFSSKGYNNELKFLGQIPRTDNSKSYSEEWLEGKIDNHYEKEFYNKYINNRGKKKITNLADAFQAAGMQVKTLMEVLPKDTILRVHSGEEDRKNIGYLEDAYVAMWAKEKNDQIKEDKLDVESKLNRLIYENFIGTIKKDVFNNVLEDSNLLFDGKEKRKDYFQRTMPQIINIIDSNMANGDMSATSQKNLAKDLTKVLYSTAKTAKNIEEVLRSNVNIIEGNLEENKKKIEVNEAALESINESAKWTDQLINGGSLSSVTWFTRHYPVFGSELELIFKKSKDHYSKNFFKWDIQQHMSFHVSSRKNISVETGVVNDINTGEKDKVEVEYDIMNDGKKNILLIHNINSSFTDNVGSRTIKDAKLESNYNNLVLQKFYSEVEGIANPDIMLLGGHSLGGFRVMPWFKKSEHMIDGEFVKGQEISYLITLPTLQSVPKLEWLSGRIINNHTKRYKKGPYGSAAILHTENADKVNSFKIIDTAKLIEFGKLASEIETYENYINDETVTDEVKAQLTNIVKENYKKIEATGDWHVGDADNKDRYSKYELLKASQTYQEEHGLPNIMSLDEAAHGTESRIFSSASRYEADTPEKFKKLTVDKILADKTMTAEDKLYLLAKESMRNHRAITIHNTAMQFEEIKRIGEDYWQKILDKNDKLIFMSGNHYNKSNKESDEATMLANMFPLKYRDNKQIIPFSGNGNDVGLGTIRLEGDKKLFAMHKFPVNQDEIYGMMKHLRSMNNDSDIVIAGDRHQTGAGYADGHLCVLHPGYETINKYVPLIGKPAGVRGFNNIYYDTNHKGIYTVEFVLNPTLEKIVERDKIM